MSAPQAVLTLIENFERNLDAYRDGKYNETQVRRDFIDPLFKALGWDMDNSLGYAEAYRDVIHEDAIKVGISTRAPDYSFRIGGALGIARLAVRSLYQELALYPKPGLVSFQDNGAHRDMDAEIFMRSLFSLRGYFVAISDAGMRNAGFAELQQLGLAAESRMLQATRCINTHRGAIFTLGILTAAAGCAFARDIAPSDDNLRAIVMDNWSGDLRAIAVARTATPSHGQLMAARHGVTGARGEALLGFPSVFEIALPELRSALEQGADTLHALLHTLFVLLAEISDTNVLYRSGAEGLRFIRMQANEFLEQGSVFEQGWLARAESMHRQCSAKNLSPGGCADLLAAAYFVHQLQTEHR